MTSDKYTPQQSLLSPLSLSPIDLTPTYIDPECCMLKSVTI